jgi:hypothetical protein
MIFFVLAYIILGAAVYAAVAWCDSRRQGPQDINFLINLSLQHPLVLILMLGLWPLALLCVFLCDLLSKNDGA